MAFLRLDELPDVWVILSNQVFWQVVHSLCHINVSCSCRFYYKWIIRKFKQNHTIGLMIVPKCSVLPPFHYTCCSNNISIPRRVKLYLFRKADTWFAHISNKHFSGMDRNFPNSLHSIKYSTNSGLNNVKKIYYIFLINIFMHNMHLYNIHLRSYIYNYRKQEI